MATHSLPTELIQMILLDHSSPTLAERPAFAVRASSVCRQWRTVVLHTPALWSTFQFSVCNCNTNLLATLLERSDAAPLDITMILDISDAADLLKAKPQKAETLLRCYSSHIYHLRIHMTALIVSNGGPIGQFLFFPSSSLEHLEIVLMAWYLPTVDMGRPFVAGNYPALKHISTTSLGWIASPVPSLTHLRLGTMTCSHVPVNNRDAARVFNGAQNLRELVLDSVLYHEPPNEAQDRFDLPNLHTLVVRSWIASHIAETASFIMKFRTPNLRAFTFAGTLPLVARLRSSNYAYPFVTRLSFAPFEVKLAQGEWGRLAETFPAVEELVLSQPVIDGPVNHFISLSGINGLLPSHWERLRIVNVTQLIAAECHDAIEAIRSALCAEYIPNCATTVLRLDYSTSSFCVRDRLTRLVDISFNN